MRTRLFFIATLLLTFFLLTSCDAKLSEKATSSRSSAASQLHSGIIDSNLPSKVNLNDEAHAYASTPGRTALSLLICRLDKSSGLQSLTQKSAQELFDMLRETAAQNAQTLESLNNQFDLTDILASEGIYVKIHGNVADSLPTPTTPAAGWAAQFESAYAAASVSGASS